MATRRDFLSTTAALPLLGAGSALSLSLAQAQTAASAGGITQVAGVQRLSVGEVIVTALLDGYLDLEPQILIGIEPEAVNQRLREIFLQPGRLRATVSAYALQFNALTILVDTGTANLFGPTVGKLLSSLQAAGIDPASVDHLFVTHLHPDHIGGVVADSMLALPNAEMIVSQAEVDFWRDEATMSQASEQMQNFTQLARRALETFNGRIRRLAGETDIAPGITAVPLPGHTPGHMGLRIAAGDEVLMIWGDIVHAPAIQFARPDVSIAFDIDPQQAATTRQRLLDQVASDGVMVAGMHLDFPGFGHVVREGEGYRFMAAQWQHEL